MSQKEQRPDKDNSGLSPEIVRKFIDTQEKELDIRQQELSHREKEMEMDYDLAIRSLDAQERDRNKSRDYFSNLQLRRYIFIGVLGLLAILFLGFAIWMNEANLAMEIIKIASYIIAGGLGGYAIGYNRADRDSSKNE